MSMDKVRLKFMYVHTYSEKSSPIAPVFFYSFGPGVWSPKNKKNNFYGQWQLHINHIQAQKGMFINIASLSNFGSIISRLFTPY